MLDLKPIKARESRATKGRWIATVRADVDGEKYCAGIGAESGPIVKTDEGFYPPNVHDAEFIAHAREDVPALVAEVERLRAELEGHRPGMTREAFLPSGPAATTYSAQTPERNRDVARRLLDGVAICSRPAPHICFRDGPCNGLPRTGGV